MDAATHWVGRPMADREKVYALFHQTNVPTDLEQRWYVYGISHDAVRILYKDLPEAVRMAYLLIQ